jgi:hypothetical protein
MKFKSILVDGLKVFVVTIVASIVSMLVATLLGVGALVGSVVNGNLGVGIGVFGLVVVFVVYVLCLGFGKQLLFKK